MPADDAVDDDDIEASLAPAREDIAEHGYHFTYVFDTDDEDPPFCYSVGLWETWRHPELLIYGLGWEDNAVVVLGLAEAIREGAVFSDGDTNDDLFNQRVAFIEIPPENYEGNIPITIMYYRGGDFPALQVVTPDEEGRFPWEPGYEPARAARQRLLGDPPTG